MRGTLRLVLTVELPVVGAQCLDPARNQEAAPRLARRPAGSAAVHAAAAGWLSP